MTKEKVTGIITSKEYQQLSDNYKLKIITPNKQKLFFYSQQRHREAIWEITVNEKYLFTLFKGKKYWFLDDWEKTAETSQEIPEWLSKRKKELSDFNLKNLQFRAKETNNQLEEQLTCLEEQLSNLDNGEEIFLDYFEQFINLLLIKHLGIKNGVERELTEKEKKEQAILNKIVANWFYKT